MLLHFFALFSILKLFMMKAERRFVAFIFKVDLKCARRRPIRRLPREADSFILAQGSDLPSRAVIRVIIHARIHRDRLVHFPKP